MSKSLKLTALTPEELARILSQAGRKPVSGEDVLAIATLAGIVQNGTINLIEFTAYLAKEVAGGAD